MNACSMENCSKPIKRTGLCYGHYMKQWRYGTPTPNHPSRHSNLVRRRFGTLTVVARYDGKWICRCDCGKYRVARTGDLNRTKEANTCGIPGQHLDDSPGYGAAHERVKRVHGAPSTHDCVDCGGRAAHWSYNHTDPNELYAVGLSAQPIAYSPHPEHYSPRCVSCHKVYDLRQANATYAA